MANNKGMTARELRNVLFSTVLFAIAVVYAIRFITGITKVLIALAITILVALVLNPIVTWAARHKVPRGAAAALLALSAIALVVALVWTVGPMVVGEGKTVIGQIPHLLSIVKSWLSPRAPGLAAQIPTSLGEVVGRLGIAATGVLGYATSIADVLASLAVILVGSIYLLTNPSPLVEGILGMFPQGKQDQVVTILRRMGEQMRAWAVGTALGMLAVGVLTWIALTIVGVHPALLFALIAGFLELIPIVGPVLSAFPPGLAALAGPDPIKVVYVIIAFTIIQQMENHLIVPLVQSSSLRLHPVSVVFVVLIMGGLFGIVGIFLATPTAAVIKILYEEIYKKPRQQNEAAIKEKAEQIVQDESPL